MVTRRFLVTGRVQGVGFRWATRGQARRSGLVGTVRNLGDGSVEVVAQGRSTATEALAVWLFRGPAGAQVEAVDAEDVAPIEAEGFRIVD